MKYKYIYSLFIGLFFIMPKYGHAQLSSYDLNRPVGFGENITGGEGSGSLNITVTSESELKNALKTSGKHIIYLKGEINLSTCMQLSSISDKTILGLPGAILTNPNRTKDKGGLLYLKSSKNIIIRNITFIGAGAFDVDGYDNLGLEGCTNIWVDHCDFQDGMDGNLDCTKGSDNIAVTWCRFRYFLEPKMDGITGDGSGEHRYTNLWGGSDSETESIGKLNTTFMFCWWDEGCVERMPRVRFGKVHILNCLYNSNKTNYAIGLGKSGNIFVENTSFIGIKKPYREINSGTSAAINFKDCYFNKTTPSNNGTAFIPNYTTALTTIPATQVQDIVSGSYGAGATLNVKENAGVITSGSHNTIIEENNDIIIRTEYYSISGTKLQTPLQGFNIVKYILKNGKIKTEKIYLQ